MSDRESDIDTTNSQGRFSSIRHPVRTLREICAGEPAFPLFVLFGLNAVDELDRAAFGILLPEIRDHFGLDAVNTSRLRPTP